VNRRPERLADLLPGVVADLAHRHTTNRSTTMTEPDPLREAANVLYLHRHNLEPDVLRTLADTWSCGSAARYGEPSERFWCDHEADGFYDDHDVNECEAENELSVGVDGAA
jgi:hypothetical protein